VLKSVFAEEAHGKDHCMRRSYQTGSYKLTIFGPVGGEIASSSGIRLSVSRFLRGRFDTVMVAGGSANLPKDAIDKVVA
jgi:hypothetical protein